MRYFKSRSENSLEQFQLSVGKCTAKVITRSNRKWQWNGKPVHHRSENSRQIPVAGAKGGKTGPSQAWFWFYF